MCEGQDIEVKWRDLAKEAFILSQQLADPGAKRILLQIAEAYERLAERAKLQNLGDTTSNTS
jgi:hypothetical protein